MNKLSTLQLLAVNAAKSGDWQKASIINEEILALNPLDIGALNRLGLSYMQLDKSTKAKQCFNKVLELDSSNSIAKKNLDKIKNKLCTTPNFSQENFIEEPGKTKIVELHRLAGKEILNRLGPGQTCELKMKNRYISVETSDGKYIGTLPEDLSFRLTKLINRKNRYECFVHSSSTKSCTIYIKEVERSAQNANIHSFPLNKSLLTTINDIDEKFLLEDNIPMEIIHTDMDLEDGDDFSERANRNLDDDDNQVADDDED
jgi:hypothetical protein